MSMARSPAILNAGHDDKLGTRLLSHRISDKPI